MTRQMVTRCSLTRTKKIIVDFRTESTDIPSSARCSLGVRKSGPPGAPSEDCEGTVWRRRWC
jgi:hypothetical protein